MVRLGDALFKVHLRVKIPLRLKIFHQVAPAFDQQAAVHGVFLENGNQLAQLALRNLRAEGSHLKNWSAFDGKRRSDRVFFFVIVERLQADLGLQMVSALEILEYPVDPGLKTALSQRPPSGETDRTKSAAPASLVDNAGRRFREVAGERHTVEMRAISRIHDEVNSNFLRLRPAIDLYCDVGLIKSVGVQSFFNILGCLLKVGWVKWRSKFKLRRGRKLTLGWRFRRAFDGHAADEKGEGRPDAHRDSAGNREALDRNVRKASGLIQLLDRGPDVGAFENRSSVEGKQPFHFGDRKRLLRRVEFDSVDDPALDTCGRFLPRRDDPGDEQRHNQHRRTHAPQ